MKENFNKLPQEVGAGPYQVSNPHYPPQQNYQQPYQQPYPQNNQYPQQSYPQNNQYPPNNQVPIQNPQVIIVNRGPQPQMMGIPGCHKCGGTGYKMKKGKSKPCKKCMKHKGHHHMKHKKIKCKCLIF